LNTPGGKLIFFMALPAIKGDRGDFSEVLRTMVLPETNAGVIFMMLCESLAYA
jgi:hypothetical protein